jgi:hypothetical protein
MWYCTLSCIALWPYNLYKFIVNRILQSAERPGSSRPEKSRPEKAGPWKPSRLILTFFLAISLVILMQPAAMAVVVVGLFDVEIAVPDESRASRQVALSDGLAEVLVRVSGDSNILQELRPPSPSSYIKQVRYITVKVPEAERKSGSQEARVKKQSLLKVQYNGTRIMDLLRKNSVPIWGGHRSKIVFWFAVRDGKSQYILKNSDFSVLKKEADAAFSRRGIPVVWPKNDSRDRKEVGFADVWAGFADPLLKASERYSSGPIVSVNALWNGHAWTGDWSLFMGQDSRRWSLRETEYDALISKGIDRVADSMGGKFAILEVQDASKLKKIFVEIDQVNSVKKFRKVQKYLTSLPIVHSVKLSQVEAERVAFQLSLRTGIDGFLGLVKSDSEIVPDVSQQADGGQVAAMPNFVYRFKLTD